MKLTFEMRFGLQSSVVMVDNGRNITLIRASDAFLVLLFALLLTGGLVVVEDFFLLCLRLPTRC